MTDQDIIDREELLDAVSTLSSHDLSQPFKTYKDTALFLEKHCFCVAKHCKGPRTMSRVVLTAEAQELFGVLIYIYEQGRESGFNNGYDSGYCQRTNT